MPNITILTVRIESNGYLRECATRAGCSQEQLISKLLTKVIDGRTVETVMGLKPVVSLRSDVGSLLPPKAEIEHPLVHRRPALYTRHVPTKNELRESLTEAVMNTGGRQISSEERRRLLIGKIKVRGRLCPSDLGGEVEQRRWHAIFKQLTDEGVIRKNAPEPRTRRVYYELCPTAGEAVTSSPTVSNTALSSPASVPDDTECSASMGDRPMEADADARTVDIPNFMGWQN